MPFTRFDIQSLMTISFIVAILVCAICDFAIAKRLTWSLYPITAILFAWLVIVPIFHFKKSKITISLISLSIFVMPFLFCIEQISGTAGWFLPLGVPIAVGSLVYLWAAFILSVKIKNKWFASGVSLILLLALSLCIDALVGGYVGQPFFDVWDAMSIGIVTVVAIVLFTVGRFNMKEC